MILTISAQIMYPKLYLWMTLIKFLVTNHHKSFHKLLLTYQFDPFKKE